MSGLFLSNMMIPEYLYTSFWSLFYKCESKFKTSLESWEGCCGRFNKKGATYVVRLDTITELSFFHTTLGFALYSSKTRLNIKSFYQPYKYQRLI